MKTGIILVAGVMMAVVGTAAEKPLWDLAKDEIPADLQSGKIEKVDGKVTLKDGAAFGVPAKAFPDQKNFTVQVTATLLELVQHSMFTAMNKQTAEDDSGFSFAMNYRDEPWYARQVFTAVNKVYMNSRTIGGKSGPKVNTPYTFTLSVQNGFASFYINDYPFKKCYMEMIPNDVPMWIGRNTSKATCMPVVISDVKVYGSSFKYVSKHDKPSKNPRGVVAGKGWALDVPKMDHPDWPKVLIYGDSISQGYRGDFIPDMLKKNIYVFHCCHFVNGGVPKPALTEMAGRYKFDVVVFNNGLHSLHWTPDKVSDEEVEKRMRDLAQCMKKGAPQAKIYYLMTTPHTAKRPAPGKPVEALGDKNDVVVRLNTISEKVMKDEGIEVIDVYSILAGKLGLAGGDGYHWQRPAYKIISDEISKKVLPAVGKK